MAASEVEFCEGETIFEGGEGDMLMEEFLEELLKSMHSCTHTHMYNPPGTEEGEQKHTCFHAHTRLLKAAGDRSGSTAMAEGEKSVVSDHGLGSSGVAMCKNQSSNGEEELIVSDCDEMMCKIQPLFGENEGGKLVIANHSYGDGTSVVMMCNKKQPFCDDNEEGTPVIPNHSHDLGASGEMMCKKQESAGNKEGEKLVIFNHGHGELMCKKQAFGGNKEAVRKYREKKKAHASLLEEQVLHLRAANEQLVLKLQAHELLQAEVVRLRQILAEFRGRIDSELLLLSRTEASAGRDVSSQGEHGSLQQQQQQQLFPQVVSDQGAPHRPPSTASFPVQSCISPCDIDNIHCLYHCDPHGPPTPQGHGSFVVNQSSVSCDMVDGGTTFSVPKRAKRNK